MCRPNHPCTLVISLTLECGARNIVRQCFSLGEGESLYLLCTRGQASPAVPDTRNLERCRATITSNAWFSSQSIFVAASGLRKSCHSLLDVLPATPNNKQNSREAPHSRRSRGGLRGELCINQQASRIHQRAWHPSPPSRKNTDDTILRTHVRLRAAAPRHHQQQQNDWVNIFSSVTVLVSPRHSDRTAASPG